MTVILTGLLCALVYVFINKKMVGVSMANLLIVKVLGLSVCRYLIFSFQFFCMLAHFNPSLAYMTIILGIGWIFLIRSVLPSLLGGVGIREASALSFFYPYEAEAAMILMPCMLIWLINTVLPSLLGSITIFKLKVNIAK